MSAPLHEFRVCEETLEKHNTVTVMIAASVAVVVVIGGAIALAISPAGLRWSSFVLLAIAAVFLGGWSVFFRRQWIDRLWRAMQLRLFEDRLERVTGKHTDVLPWSDVRKVVEWQGPAGDVRALELIVSPGNRLHLVMFEGMEQLAECIRSHLPEGVPTEVHRGKVDFRSPTGSLVVAMFVALGVALAIGVARLHNTAYADMVNGVVLFTAGTSMMGLRPMSKANPGMQGYERSLGALFCVVGFICLARWVL